MNKTIITLQLILTFLTLGLAQNNSLDFEGTDDYVNLGNQVGNNIRTIELWFNPTVNIDNSISNFFSLIVRDGSPVPWGFGLSFIHIAPNGGKLRFHVQDINGGGTSIYSNSSSWNSNQWYHVAGVIDQTSGMKMFIDGVLQSDTDPYSDNTGTNTNENTTIGRWGDFTGNRYFNGKVDDVRFWNTARTQSEIQNNMNTELTGTESGLISYYKMDETNSSCDIEDCNSNENHGARYGTGGSNNLPQFSTDVPSITDVACGVTTTCFSCPQNTVFTVVSGNNWNTVDNWSGGCVPNSPITENITINGDCNLNIVGDFIFESTSSLTINSSNTLTVSGAGNMNLKGTTTNNGILSKSTITNEGTYKGNGTFIGDFINNGVLSPSGN